MDIRPPSLNLSTNDCVAQVEAPPPYHKSATSPVVVAETTTTWTEIVTTTTTTGTTTQLFSLPYWKKSNGHPSPSNSTGNPHSASSSANPFFDKALPPTPPDETPDLHAVGQPSELPHSAKFSSSVSHPEVWLGRSRKFSAGQETTVALAHAALGIGLPHASTSFSRADTNTIAFMTSPVSPTGKSLPSANLRRVKSSQRVQARHLSEAHKDLSSEHSKERRLRGISFTATSRLNPGNTDVKGKGHESEQSPVSPKPSPKPLARKSSFWKKKKGSDSSESVVKQGQYESIPILPPLPLVHHIPPLNFSDFTAPSAPSTTEETTPTHSPGLSRSHSENLVLTRSPLLSPEMTTKPVYPPPPSSSSCENFPILHPSGECPIPRRSRTQSNTPLLHRLSMGVFSPGESSPMPSARLNGYSQPHRPHVRNSETPIPKPLREEESPEVYLRRLKMAVSKAEVAGILASSTDPFYSEALRAYISQFDFFDFPLDVALRKLLMEVGLPRETQQIDRVMEAFAFRYAQCNPNVFISVDHPYILAFSLIMLHTDVFNPSNKRKMTKSDYIKNTKLPGIASEVLECFFDNTVFAPFIFIEDPVDFNGLIPDVTRSTTITAPTLVLPSSNGGVPFKIGNKIDPYYLIINNLLEPLRVDIQVHIPLENPFTYEGTAGSWDEQELHQAFLKASVVEVEVPVVNRVSPIFSLNPSGTPVATSGSELPDTSRLNDTWGLKMTKVGLLNRKDDMTEGGKKSSNRKWKVCSVILTGSQLLFFRDPGWASALSQSPDLSVEFISPPSNIFRPDESFSLKDTVAVYDYTYTKYKHTFRFILPSGRQLLLQASDDKDLNEWISRINYASTFKSAGIKMRPPGLSGEDVHLTGVAAATSHLHDMQQQSGLPRPHSWDSNAPHILMDMLTSQPNSQPTLQRRVTVAGKSIDFEHDVHVAPDIHGAEQFKATFDQVRADLAASWPSSDNEPSFLEQSDDALCESPPISPKSFDSKFSRLPSRSQIIQAKIRDLDSKILASQSQLDSDVRCARNIAILTPFQKSTRSKLSSAVQGMAQRVALLRLELEKLKCYRTVLRRDLTSEGRTWHHSKQMALLAAKETLQSRRSHTIPTMRLSLPCDLPTSLTDPQFPIPPCSQGPESSICGSFHSATEFGFDTDFGFDWPSADDTNFLAARYESTKRSLSASTPSFQVTRHELDQSQNLRRSTSMSSNSNHLGSKHTEIRKAHSSGNIPQGDEEQAEEWNRTRCAHRVSLIRVPPDIRMLKKPVDP